MRNVVSSSFVSAIVGALILGTLQTAPAAEQSAFSYSLFDGQTLDGWTVENDCEVELQDGMILLKSGNGWLRSDHQYADFELHVEWKAFKQTGYDAGIYFRAGAEGKPWPKRGYQANLLQGKEGHIGNLAGATSTGLIKPAMPGIKPAMPGIKPAGEWNTFDITVVGETVSLVINGKPAYKVGGLKQESGYVGIQVEVPKGGRFLLRNLRITEFGYRSLFNGKDLTGWEGAGRPAELCWRVEEDAITCTGKKGPWLRTKEEFSDFNLRFEYQVAPGGNSGIYVRVPAKGSHHRDTDQQPPAGFEVQILDDSAGKYAKLKDYQFCGSVYDIRGATRRVGKPPGKWNTMEINCKGQHVTTAHNGVEIVDVTPEKFPLINLRQMKGFLGLQNHSTVVKFRNLRIGPAVGE